MNDRAVRVIIVEDHAMVLDAITSVLDQRPEIEIVERATSVAEGASVIASRSADVILADLHLGDGLGTELVEHANRRNPEVPVLLLSGADDQRGVEAALGSGCAGFVGKSQGLGHLVDSVLSVARGAAVFPAALLTRSIGGPSEPAVDLSPRELEVLRLLGSAYSIPEIAGQLHLSVHTVRNHIKQILAKLGAHSQLEAVVIAAREGHIEIR